ncbi:MULTISPECIES: DUF6332 family protein [unclassified Streptomyces]|uniref:DUF6332 family protein n=1 Tax=unclassified Streptomyces TaxID=2593676 RepID=UPI0037930F7D
MTIEIGYALVSAAFVAGLTFAGLLVPTLFFFDPAPTVRRVLPHAAAAAALLAFAVRLVHVLWRFPRRGHARPPAPAQPSQPGRTRPDS